MQIREAKIDDAEDACRVIRRSITELCHADHQDDAPTLALWLANKTADIMTRWITQHHVFVALEDQEILGVAAMRASGEVILNYVSPDVRFRGLSTALMRQLEARAVELGIAVITLSSTATAVRFYRSRGYRENGPPIKGFGITMGYPMSKQLARAARMG
jgi:GNAT superfamily N-acetyltransferase